MNIIVTEEQKEYLEKHIQNLNRLLIDGEINELLISIDDAIIDTFDKEGYPDEVGNRLQEIYDEIYLMN